MHSCDILEKILILVSPPHFVYDFLRKKFSCYILLIDQISSSDCLYFLRYWVICIVIICFACDDIINFEINLKFLIKPFSYMTKKVRNLKTRKIFLGEIKSIFKGFQLPEIITNSGTNPDVGLKFSGSSYIHF